MTRPNATETAPYYFRYIDLVPDGDVVGALEQQLDKTYSFLQSIDEEKSLHSYAQGKWTLRQLLNHVNDTERVFLYRALWFARGFPEPLPSFDQDVGVAGGEANNVSWTDLVEEFRNVRLATISFFKNLSADAWSRTGTASDNPFTVRALAYIIAGHAEHHQGIIQERYLN
ncbi:MAG TPA: DinB family protein [Pyrinomonadaceae bacterium]|nr:DinB family protein [Pyrinomonadaceae bacterium]